MGLKKGQINNPKGRPKGSKNEQRTLTGAYLRSFMEDCPIIDDYINFNEDF